jgi:hypothetical protein
VEAAAVEEREQQAEAVGEQAVIAQIWSVQLLVAAVPLKQPLASHQEHIQSLLVVVEQVVWDRQHTLMVLTLFLVLSPLQVVEKVVSKHHTQVQLAVLAEEVAAEMVEVCKPTLLVREQPAKVMQEVVVDMLEERR